MRLLIVEDHPITRIGVIQLLRARWPEALLDEGQNVAEALVRLAEASPDAVVMDLNFPDAAGIEGLSRIRKAAPAIPLLVLSAHAEQAYARRCLQEGAQGYLCKDRAPEELVHAVEALLAGRRYITASLAAELANDLAGTNPRERAPHELLSSREHRVLLLLAGGRSVSEIAEQMHLSPKTVSTYRSRVLEKLSLHSNVDLAKYCLQYGLTDES